MIDDVDYYLVQLTLGMSKCSVNVSRWLLNSCNEKIKTLAEI